MLTRCSERACKCAEALARAGKGDKYVSKGDYPACKKKPSLRVLAAADAIRKANPNSSATRSQFIFTVYLQAGSITISAQPEPRASHQFHWALAFPSRAWFEHITQPLKKSFLCTTNSPVRRRYSPC